MKDIFEPFEFDIMLGLRRFVTGNFVRTVTQAKFAVPIVAIVPRTTQALNRSFVTCFPSQIIGKTLSQMKTSSGTANMIECVGKRWMGSTVKKRRAKMNKHKLKKRRKSLRMNTKISRQ